MREKRKSRRYAAKLLFQFRVSKDAISNKKRVCEERIILLHAASAKKALIMAKKRGVIEEFSYDHADKSVFFEFIGIVELIELGVETEKDEVWWKLIEMVRPMENRKKLIPADHKLSALQTKSSDNKRRIAVP